MFRLEGENKAEVAARFKAEIEALPAVISELKSAEVGLDLAHINGNWDIVLTAVCNNETELDIYAKHPAHIACVGIIKPLLSARACVDYEA